ncbi:Pectinesterase [Bertholletia excelsa]
MERANLVLILFLLSWLSHMTMLVSGQGNSKYVQDACQVTRYPDICIHTLASFSRTARNDPRRWVRAGVSVTVGGAKDVAQYLLKLKSRGSMRGRRRAAVSDCVECFQDAVDNLHRSLAGLRQLGTGRRFDEQMKNVTTWLSAALTDEDTCLDGFEGQNGKQVELLRNKVLNASYITSNALALANKLATTGTGSIGGDP